MGVEGDTDVDQGDDSTEPDVGADPDEGGGSEPGVPGEEEPVEEEPIEGEEPGGEIWSYCDPGYGYWYAQVRRSVYLEDNLVTISDYGVKFNDLNAPETEFARVLFYPAE